MKKYIRMIKEKTQLMLQKFVEAFTACALCMVQGDLSVFTLKHALTAAKTGGIAGFAFVIISCTAIKNKLAPVWLTGVLTACADIMVHPTHFGPWYAEAITTGVVAAFLAFVFTKIGERKNANV